MDILLNYFPKSIVNIILKLSTPTFLELLEIHFQKYDHRINSLNDFIYSIQYNSLMYVNCYQYPD